MTSSRWRRLRRRGRRMRRRVEAIRVSRRQGIWLSVVALLVLAGGLFTWQVFRAVDALQTASERATALKSDIVAGDVDAARADREDLALLGLLLRGVRDDEAGGRGLLGLARLDDDAVLERLDGNRHVWPFPRHATAGVDGTEVEVPAHRHRPPSRGSTGPNDAGRFTGTCECRVLTPNLRPD